jgi:hypothetical protein
MLRAHVIVGDWRDLMPHPIADLFPLLQGEELRALERDIRENGFDGDRPIVIFEGKILDGRNRHRACLVQDNGVDPLTKPEFVRFEQAISDPSPLQWVISVNLNRRHLDEAQRAMVAAKIANMREGRPSETTQICGVSQTEAAAMLNVSPRSVSTAKALLRDAPELAEEVNAGRRTLNSACVEVKQSGGKPGVVKGGGRPNHSPSSERRTPVTGTPLFSPAHIEAGQLIEADRLIARVDRLTFRSALVKLGAHIDLRLQEEGLEPETPASEVTHLSASECLIPRDPEKAAAVLLGFFTPDGIRVLVRAFVREILKRQKRQIGAACEPSTPKPRKRSAATPPALVLSLPPDEESLVVG